MLPYDEHFKQLEYKGIDKIRTTEMARLLLLMFVVLAVSGAVFLPRLGQTFALLSFFIVVLCSFLGIKRYFEYLQAMDQVILTGTRLQAKIVEINSTWLLGVPPRVLIEVVTHGSEGARTVRVPLHNHGGGWSYRVGDEVSIVFANPSPLGILLLSPRNVSRFFYELE